MGPPPSPGDVSAIEMLPLKRAAKVAGVSETTLRRLIDDGAVEAIRQGGALRISQSTVLELRTGGLKRGAHVGVAVRETDRIRGETAADAFERFAKGEQLVDVVRELRQDPDVIERLWDRWVALQQKQRAAFDHEKLLKCKHEHCGEGCDGPVRVDIGLCHYHQARTHFVPDGWRPVSPEAQAVLDGREIPTALHCTECDEMSARGVCSTCASKATTLTLEGEDEGRHFIARRGDKVIMILSATQSLGLARQLLEKPPQAQPEGTAPPAPPPVDVGTMFADAGVDAARLEQLKARVKAGLPVTSGAPTSKDVADLLARTRRAQTDTSA